MDENIRYLCPFTVIPLLIAAIVSCGRDQEGPEPTPTPEEPPRGLRIIFTTDLHSHLQGFGPESEYSPYSTGDDPTVGGVSRLATAINTHEEETEHPVLILDAGDFSMGTLYEFLFTTSSPELCLFREMGYSATTFGNHEFDFTPSGLASMLTTSILNECEIDVVSSNILFDEEDPGDDELENVYLAGGIEDYITGELANGLTYGTFGLLGEGAAETAPMAGPVTFADPISTAQGVVEVLKEEGVDVIICLSHSGISLNGGVSEDQELAMEVPDIDVIISGHTHIPLSEPIIEGETIIVQAGANGEYIGLLDLEEGEDGDLALAGYALVAVDDSIPGDAGVQELVDGYSGGVDALLNPATGLEHDTPVAETSFDIENVDAGESALGNLVADSMRFVSTGIYPDSPMEVAIEANGILRDPIEAGAAGLQTVADLFRVVPLGIGPSGIPGYPLVSFYLTPYEIKMGLEACLEISAFSPDYFLQVSGLRFEYDPNGEPLSMITAIYTGDEMEGYSEEPLDTSPENGDLMRVVMNLYSGYMMSTISDYTDGLAEIVPKDAMGNPLSSIEDGLLDADPDDGEFTELKEWLALVYYVSSFPDGDGDSIPDFSSLYASPLGRITEVSSGE